MSDDELDIQTFLGEARQGRWRPVNVLVGSETLLIERAARYLKKATVGADGVRGFNDDLFHGQGLSGAKVAAAARTLPMMAAARYVLVRDLESMAPTELDALADYVAKPSPSTCLVLIGDKLDGKTKLAKAAKALTSKEQSEGRPWGAYLVVEPLKGALLDRFVAGEAKRRRCVIEPDAQALLVDAIGNDLAAMEDAIERLSLYVGGDAQGARITRRAVEDIVQRVRVDTVWKLIDSIALKRQKVAVEALGSMLADREQPLGILGHVARQLRIVSRMKDALDEGLRPDDAVKRAGAPPFKARDLAEAARKFSQADLRRAFRLLAETDQALKGSRREPEIVLEEAVLALTR